MGKRSNIKTTIQQAVDYWASRIDECELSVDWFEADTHCWRCGCEKNLQRCHIVPDSLGGQDAPSNIVLLCERCHIDGPNVTDPELCRIGSKLILFRFMILFGVSLVQKNIGLSIRKVSHRKYLIF